MPADTDVLNYISQIWNCEHAFEIKCPRHWDLLAETDEQGVRFCDQCNENVTLCSTPEEFVRLGNAGQCVAVPDGLSPSTLDMVMMGRPSPEHVQELTDRKRDVEQWWHKVRSLMPRFSPNAFNAIRIASRRFRRIHQTKD